MALPTRPRADSQQKESIKIGLDHGTTFTAGVVVCTTHATVYLRAMEVEPFRKYPGVLGEAKNRPNSEIPSCIQYENNFIRIGFEATRSEENGECASHAQTIWSMKFGLDEQDEFRQEREQLLMSMPEGKTPDSVLQDYFRVLFKSWKAELKELGFAEDSLVEFNCAVPAAWTTTRPVRRLSDIIIKAATQSGLNIDKAIRFWTEPVAATAYLARNDDTFRRHLKASCR